MSNFLGLETGVVQTKGELASFSKAFLGLFWSFSGSSRTFLGCVWLEMPARAKKCTHRLCNASPASEAVRLGLPAEIRLTFLVRL